MTKQICFENVSRKLSGPMTSTKCYWSLLKALLNRRKIPYISHIFHNNEYVKEKNKF